MKNKIKKIAVVALALISVLVVSILPCSAVSVPNYNITDDEYTHYTVVSYDFGTEFVFLSNCELAVLQTSNMSYVNNPNGYWVKKIQLHENYSAEVNDGTLYKSIHIGF